MEKSVNNVEVKMLSYEEIYKIVKEKLSEKRFYHSECVVDRCIEYAKIYGVDIEKIRIAGIAHDIAKEIPKEKQLDVAKEYGLELDEIEKVHYPLVHAILLLLFYNRYSQGHPSPLQFCQL